MALSPPQYPSRWFAIGIVVILVSVFAQMGCAHNPGYFPDLIPGGRIQQTHAKPRGRGYLHNFDPKAVLLEVTPTQANNQPKTQQVLIATVSDADGQPRRGRRVEWMIDGPGNLIEVDESGWTAGRGYKVDNKYGVCYTSYREQILDRGNDDPSDDITIRPGQTWCVVSCPVPGESVVTAYAPEVYKWECGRVFVRLQWNDNDFAFPPPATTRYGGEASLSTVINRLTADAGLAPDDVRIRYRVVGGAPAELIPGGKNAVVSGARGGQSQVDVTADFDGRAPVRVVQNSPKQGKTNIAVEILKPDPNGVGPETVVGRTLTSVEWIAPQIGMEVKTAKVVGLNRDVPMSLIATNPSGVETSAVTIRTVIPEGVDFLSAEPAPTTQTGRELVWNVGALSPGQKQEVSLTLKPTRQGTINFAGRASTNDGLQSDSRVSFDVGTAALRVQAQSEPTIGVNQRFPVKISVSNTGAVPLDNAIAWLTVPIGLEHDTQNITVESTIGSIPAGQTKTVDIPLIARQPGPQKIDVTVTADGGLSERSSTSVEVRRMEIATAITGEERLNPGQDTVYEVKVRNIGEVAVRDVRVLAVLPQGLTAKDTTEQGTIRDGKRVEWVLPSLAAGENLTFKISATASQMQSRSPIQVTVNTDTNSGAKGLSAEAKVDVEIVGQPALVLDLAEPRDPVPVGRQGQYRVTIRNRGTGAAKDVQVAVTLPDEVANARGVLRNGETVKVEGDQVVFPLIADLPAGGQQSYIVEVEGAKAGTARVRAEAKASYLSQPLREEQVTRILER